jgi:transposase
MLNIAEAIEAARKQLYQDMAVSADGEVFRLLQTIKGIGPYVAASLIGEIQDIRRFTSAKALTAYTGLDPKIRQSGKALNSTGRLTKRGSAHLRRSLFIAASVARRYDPQFKALYDKKRAEGKSYKVATCIVARKLLMVVRSVWLSGMNYYVPE